jgi:hypothetical protein
MISTAMLDKMANGTIRKINGIDRIYYDGYWILYYDIPNTLTYKKQLIDQLTRRVFHHTEHGINTPGERLDEVRAAYEAEEDSYKKRVLAAMLAGALMNRGSDILTHMVELEEMGVKIEPDNGLIKECGQCFMGSLKYGKFIRSKTGKEGLDELWGEPFKVFSMPVEQYHASRYIKVAQTMTEIDAITDKLSLIFKSSRMFPHIVPIIHELGESAKSATETIRSDTRIIEIWPQFVGASDRIAAAKVKLTEESTRKDQTLAKRGLQLIQDGAELIISHSNSRMPMPNTTAYFLERCDAFKKRYAVQLSE